MKSMGTTENYANKNHDVYKYNQNKIDADKTKIQKKSAYQTIDDCINAISEKIDVKFLDKRQVKLTIEKEAGVKFRELERVKEEISQNSEKTSAWKAIDNKVMNFIGKLEKIRISDDFLGDASDNFSAKTIDASSSIFEYVTLSIGNKMPISDIQIKVNELASSHKIQSVEFSSDLAKVVQDEGDHINENMFTAGSFKIAVLNNIRASEGFAGENIDITDENTLNHFKVGGFNIVVNENLKRIEIKKGETLKSLKEKINNSVKGVKASIVQDVVKDSILYRLVIKSAKAGPEHYYTVIDEGGILNNQFSHNDKSGKYRDYATVTISKGYNINDIAAAINSHSETTNVNAKIFRVKEQEYRMILSAGYAGEGNLIKLEDPDLCLNGVFKSKDAVIASPRNSKIVIDGITIERESNDIKDIYGRKSISLHLKKKTDNPLHIRVVSDVSVITDLIKGFVDNYNALLKEMINQKMGDENRNGFGKLQNDFQLANIFEDISIPVKNRIQLKNCGITMIDQDATINENGEAIPEYSGLLSIDEGELNSKIYEDLDAVKAALIFVLKSESLNFMLPLDFERQVVNFGSKKVDSIMFYVDLNEIGFVSTRSKSFKTNGDSIVSKDGQIVINGNAISIQADCSLDILAKKINNAFSAKYGDPNMKASVLRDESGYYIALDIVSGVNLEIVDYDNVLEGLFAAKIDQFESVKFASMDDIAVNADGESSPNLLNAGSFKINGRNIDIKKGDTWLDIVTKMEEIGLRDLDVVTEESSGQYQIVVQLHNLEEKLEIQDFHGILNSAFTLTPGSGGRKFFDTTNVANAILHTETGDIERHVLYHPDNAARNIKGQRALLDIFNMPNEEFMSCRLAYYNREEGAMIEKSSLSLSQGITERMGIKLAGLSYPNSSSIMKAMKALKDEMGRLETRKAQLEKECDSACNNAAAFIWGQKDKYDMNKHISRVLVGTEKEKD